MEQPLGKIDYRNKLFLGRAHISMMVWGAPTHDHSVSVPVLCDAIAAVLDAVCRAVRLQSAGSAVPLLWNSVALDSESVHRIHLPHPLGHVSCLVPRRHLRSTDAHYRLTRF